MRFAEIFKTELFSKYGQKAGCYINEIYDIMNLDRFILEVPVELRMRRKQRKKEDIINLAVLLP